MDIEKMKKWLEITNQSNFWSSVLQHKAPDDFFRNNEHKSPLYDLYQNEYYNFIIVEIPGINREDVTLNLISKSQLLIKGIIKPILPMEIQIKRERAYGEIERVIELSEATEAHHLNIQFFNGLLLISYPRKVENVKF